MPSLESLLQMTQRSQRATLQRMQERRAAIKRRLLPTHFRQIGGIHTCLALHNAWAERFIVNCR